MSGFFKSEGYKIAFYILEASGEAQVKGLRITQFYYHNKQGATRWRDDILVKLNDLDNQDIKTRAINELNKIYERMIDVCQY